MLYIESRDSALLFYVKEIIFKGTRKFIMTRPFLSSLSNENGKYHQRCARRALQGQLGNWAAFYSASSPDEADERRRE